jgi:hypothetical protein
MATPFFASGIEVVADTITVSKPHGLGGVPDMYGAFPVAIVAGKKYAVDVTVDGTNVNVKNNDGTGAAVSVIMFAARSANLVEQTDANHVANNGHRVDAAGTSHTTLVTNATNASAVATSLVKSAAENTLLRNFPTGYSASREGTLSTGSIGVGGTYVRTLAQLQAAFPAIDFSLPVEFESGNNLVVASLTTPPTIADGVTFTNLDTVNAQVALIKVKQIHSFNR